MMDDTTALYSSWAVGPRPNRATRRLCARRGHVPEHTGTALVCKRCGKTLLIGRGFAA